MTDKREQPLPPRASPQVKSDRPGELGDDEPATDPGMRAVLKRYAEREAVERAAEEQRLKSSGWMRTAVTVVGSTVVSLAAAFLVVFNVSRAVAQDAGLPLTQRVVTLEQQRKEDRAEQGNRMERIEQNQNADHGLILGVSQKLDVLLSAQGVRNPAPTPKDGGR
jgi:hypothetical protein